jgi:hypothetical protein
MGCLPHCWNWKPRPMSRTVNVAHIDVSVYIISNRLGISRNPRQDCAKTDKIRTFPRLTRPMYPYDWLIINISDWSRQVSSSRTSFSEIHEYSSEVDRKDATRPPRIHFKYIRERWCSHRISDSVGGPGEQWGSQLFNIQPKCEPRSIGIIQSIGRRRAESDHRFPSNTQSHGRRLARVD